MLSIPMFFPINSHHVSASASADKAPGGIADSPIVADTVRQLADAKWSR